MEDAWDELRLELGPLVGAEFLRRLRGARNGDVSLHAQRQRGVTIRAWVLPPESIPLTPETAEAQNP